ncbi:hypothetical protein, partial [Paenibacillus kobensis]|uniref:hypothetical protein n=1 Tax=Paenibacillus kobensis TaxID=59841 RepID=UPI0013E3CE91
MSILKELSSQVGERSQDANRAAAQRCLDEPALLAEIAEAFSGRDAALLGDCCEVLTKVAESRPELVVPYLTLCVPLLSHKTTRVRWEAMHAIALTAHLIPETASVLSAMLAVTIREDSSTIVRDYAVDALGGIARSSEAAAAAVYPLLRDALTAADGKHAGRALAALRRVVESAPGLALEVLQIAHDYADHGKPAVRKAAKMLLHDLPGGQA